MKTISSNILKEKSILIDGYSVILQKDEKGLLIISSPKFLMKNWVLDYAYDTDIQYSYSDVYGINDDDTLEYCGETFEIDIDENDEDLEYSLRKIIEDLRYNFEN